MDLETHNSSVSSSKCYPWAQNQIFDLIAHSASKEFLNSDWAGAFGDLTAKGSDAVSAPSPPHGRYPPNMVVIRIRAVCEKLPVQWPEHNR